MAETLDQHLTQCHAEISAETNFDVLQCTIARHGLPEKIAHLLTDCRTGRVEVPNEARTRYEAPAAYSMSPESVQRFRD